MAEHEVTDPFPPYSGVADDPTAAFRRATEAGVGDQRRELGQLLLSGLDALHIQPDILAWVHAEDGTQLVVVTSLVDRVGSLKLYELLFSAQDCGLIDGRVPLMDVSLYSPHTEVGLDLVKMLNEISKTGSLTVGNDQQFRVERGTFQSGFMDPSVVRGEEVIAVRSTGYTAIQDLQRWKQATTILAKAA